MAKFSAINELVNIWDKSRKPFKMVTRDYFSKEQFSYLERQFIEKHALFKIKHFVYLRFFDEYADKKRIFPPSLEGKNRDIFVLFVLEECRSDADEFIKKHLPEVNDLQNELFLKAKFHFKKFEEDIIKRSPLKKQLYVLNSFAREIVDLWLDQFSDKYVSTLMKCFNQKPQFSIRVNPQKNTRLELSDKLEKKGIFTTKSNISNKILLLKNPEQINFPVIEEYKNGDFLIQDEGEIILNQLHFAAPKEIILDINPSISQFFISYALDSHPRSHLHAICTNTNEIRSIIKRIKPLSLSRLEIIKVNSDQELYKKYRNKSDVVFVRPNNSEIGKIKNEPDKKWNISSKYINKLCDKQKKMLAKAAKLVKPNGKIIFISESFNKLENEKIISDFLVKNPNYTIDKIKNLQPDFLKQSVTKEGYLRFHPNEVPFSSYFAAVLKNS